ncbi:MAG: hypothetical protein J1F31_05580 [Erysipelotrichales bacterium]|nr:hypothetical protein [Erysipelotrichales bacterium]
MKSFIKSNIMFKVLIFWVSHYYKLFIYFFLFKIKLKDWTPSDKKFNFFLKRGIIKDRKIIFVCDGSKNHGGLADRLRGLLTIYFYSKKNVIPFFIYWDSPFKLESFIWPNTFDWRINRIKDYKNHNISFPVIIDSNIEGWKNLIKKSFLLRAMKTNKNLLVYSNLVNKKIPFKTLFNELFQCSDDLKSELNFHIKKIGSQYCSYTFRFGNLFNDFKDIVGKPLEEREKMLLLEKNINELKSLLKKLPKNFKAVVTSDSYFFLKKIENLDSRIYFVDKEIKHPEYNKNEEINTEIWTKSFLDFYLIMNAEKVYQVKSQEMYQSGFPELASLISMKPYVLHSF